jgi:sugar phosphate isomerase/epimerase
MTAGLQAKPFNAIHPLNRRTFAKNALLAATALAGLPACTSNSARTNTKPMRPFSAPLAICNETFQDWPFDKAFAFAAGCGYTGVEIAPFTVTNYVTDISAQRRAEVRRQVERAGLKVIGLHWLLAKTEGLHLTSPNPVVRERTAEYLRELARFCADLGGKVLVFGSPQQRNLAPGMSREDGLRYATEVFQAALPEVERTNTLLAFEPLSPKLTNFGTTAADGAELVRRVGSSHFRLHLDVVAMSSEPIPIPELIHQYGDMLVHFHANDANSQGPGFGDTDFGPILKALAKVRYNGWVSVEVFDYKPGPERLARESIRYMRNVLAQTAG